jgi:TonB family protein
MGFRFRLALRACAALLACIAVAQARCQESAPASGDSPTSLEEPQLLPSQAPSAPAEKCKRARYSTLNFSLLIDAEGAPRQIRLLNPQDTDEDLFAIDAVIKDRFVPGREGGVAQSLRRSMAVEVDTCVERVKDADGNKFDRLRLTGIPSQMLQPGRDSGPPDEGDGKTTGGDSGSAGESNGDKTAGPDKAGGAVAAPTLIYMPEAMYTNAARKSRIQGQCMIKVTVDSNGVPQNPQVVRPLDPGLDQNALEAVRRYRFNPAIKKGVGPVPMMITVAVSFRLFER